MASATIMEPSQASLYTNISIPKSTPVEPKVDTIMRQAIELAELVKHALIELDGIARDLLPAEPTDEEVLLLPLDDTRLDSALLSLPKRDSSNHELALAVASLLYPIHTDSLASIIRYEHDRVRLCRYIRLQRRYDILARTTQSEEHNLKLHIQQQGPWDPIEHPVSLSGPPGVPMPVSIASAASLEPFFKHLRNDGTHEIATLDASLPAQEIAEPHYNTPALEFPRGVVYEDQRLDLCKMVVGPTHIGALMESLRMNNFIKHFLLGNNIIGPKGAREIAAFVKEFPNRIDTWYLAGNAMHGSGFSELVDAMVRSPAATNIWLKRNPLGAQGSNPVNDLFRLITETPNLRTLDLDQTELGDVRVAELFERLLEHQGTPKLENLYLNGNGLHVKAATAIGKYLASPHCNITSLYMSNNPIGNDGIKALSTGLTQNKNIIRLSIQSVGMGDVGVGALVHALQEHPTLVMLDVGTSYATEDLGQVYNVLTNEAVPHVTRLIESSTSLEYLSLGIVLMDTISLNMLLAVVAESPSLLFYAAMPGLTRQRKHSELTENIRLKDLVKSRFTANVKAKHGPNMSYDKWHADEKRWCMSDKTDVRKIDSVYRTSDMGLARRGLKKLDKWWGEENEGLLKTVMGVEDLNLVGPVCTARTGKEKVGAWAANIAKA